MQHEGMERRGATLKQNPSAGKRYSNETSSGREGRANEGKGQNQCGGRGLGSAMRAGDAWPDADKRVARRGRKDARTNRGRHLEGREVNRAGNRCASANPEGVGEHSQGIHEIVIRRRLAPQHGA